MKYLGKITDNKDLVTKEYVDNADSNKVDKVSGKGLSTNDYTTAEKNKLAGIAAGAQVNSITGVKGNNESSYRTGNVNLTAANVGAVGKTDELLTTNPFNTASTRGPYFSKIDNAFYCADKRWVVTGTNYSGGLSVLFDGSYETHVQVRDGNTAVITMDFSTESNGCFPGYAYGYMLMSFYYAAKPTSVSCRVYCNYSPHGIGWHDISFAPLSDCSTNATIYRSAHQGYHNISQIEFTVVGDTTNSYGYTGITQIEMHLDRPDSSRNPFLSKYSAETLYHNLTAPKFIGDLEGNATSATTSTTATTATTSTQLSLQTAITGATINDFRGEKVRYARVSNATDIGLTSNDGIVIWIPWSNVYGRQIVYDDSTNKIFTRAYNNGTWSNWESLYHTSKSAASGGTDLSLVTTGEKYTWNNKQNALTNPVTGTGTSGYLTKWNGTNSVTSGPQLGTSTTTYLNNKGEWATPPDTKVTAVGNHYTPSGGTTTSASGATGTSGSTVQVVTGVTKDAAGHVTGITSGAATDTTYESKSAASGGTAVSLVTTGEKYTWNNKSTVPTNHASTGTSYGTGSSSNYGHVKLSDSTSSTSGTSGGIAATPSAVKSAYDLANTANTTANTALSGVNGGLIYDHTFTISNGVATFTPHVYKAGAEVTTDYATSCFVWKYRLIDGSEVALTTKSDRGCDVTISNMGYGGHVIGLFTPA